MMKTALFPPDTRAPMPSFYRNGKWVRVWERTEDGFLVRNVAVSDWESNVYAAALLAVEEET